MVIEKYSDLLMYTAAEYGVPKSFFEHDTAGDNSCIFLVSCLNTDKILFVENSFEALTGYSSENFLKGGMDVWFPLIHPEDLPMVTEKIVRSHQELFRPEFKKEQLAPLIVEYRFKRPTGEWWKIRDTKYLLFPGNYVAVDKILIKLELISRSDKQEIDVEDILRKEKSCTKMLEFALVHSNSQTKQTLTEHASHPKSRVPSATPQLTKREKEILLLIGEGLSTKMIGDKCHISINTVETHRRHLLEKLQVKNSMELIKEASKVFWL